MEIFPRIFLGDKFTASDSEFFATNRIGFVLNCTLNISNEFENITTVKCRKRKMKYITPINDVEYELNEDNLEKVIDFESMELNAQEEVYFLDSEDEEVSNFQQDTVTFSRKVQYCRISISDDLETDILSQFPKSNKFLSRAILEENNVNILIHCRRGKSRSVAMMLGFAMYGLKLSLSEAYIKLVGSTALRGHVPSMNQFFQEQLMKYELQVFKIPENSLNFFEKRNRPNFEGMTNGEDRDTNDYEVAEGSSSSDDEEYNEFNQPRKRRKLSKGKGGRRRKKKKELSEATKLIHRQIMERLREQLRKQNKDKKGKKVKLKQISIKEMFQKRKKKKKAPKKKKKKSKFKQITLDSMFKRKKK